MALYLTEEDVDAVVTIGDALEAVEGSFRRQAAGVIENKPRYRLRLESGRLAVMAASDLGLGVAGVKVYAAGPDGAKFVVTLFHAARHDVLAVIEADQLGRLRTEPRAASRRSIWRRMVRPRRHRLRAAGGDADRGGAGGAARDLVDRRLLS